LLISIDLGQKIILKVRGCSLEAVQNYKAQRGGSCWSFVVRVQRVCGEATLTHSKKAHRPVIQILTVFTSLKRFTYKNYKGI
jgi:hypothetical protein